MNERKNNDNQAIECPVCGKGRFIAVKDASGKISVLCDKCHKCLLLDLDKMKATESKPIKGAYKLVQNNGIQLTD